MSEQKDIKLTAEQAVIVKDALNSAKSEMAREIIDNEAMSEPGVVFQSTLEHYTTVKKELTTILEQFEDVGVIESLGLKEFTAHVWVSIRSNSEESAQANILKELNGTMSLQNVSIEEIREN